MAILHLRYRRRFRLPAQQMHHRCVRGLGSEIRVPEAGIALAGKGAGDPGVQVREVPQRDADAVDCLEAGLHGIDVVCGLLLVAGAGGGEAAEADVDFGVGDFDVECGEGFEVGDLRGEIWGVAYDEVALETYAIDLDVAGLERLHQVLGCGGFGA